MRRKNLIRSVIGLGLLIAFTGCAPAQDDPTAASSPIQVTQPAATVEPTLTKTPTAAATVDAAATGTSVSIWMTSIYRPSITPTFSSIPTSTAPLVEEEPWLVFLASEDLREGQKLWAINPDGTGLTKLIDEPVYAYDILHDQPLSDGFTIAYVTGTSPGGPCDCTPCGLTLKITDIPGGALRASIPLLNADIEAECPDTSDARNVVSASTSHPVWSPDGSKLAFIGAMDGPSADAYTYDLATGNITRLSDGPDHAYGLSWSPDGHYVIHRATYTYELLFEPVVGIWAARADGSRSVPLFDELRRYDEYTGRSYLSISEILMSWPADNAVILITWNSSDNTNSNVRLVNLYTGAITYIRRCCFEDFAYDENRNIWLFLVRDSEDAPSHLVFWESGIERRVDTEIDLSYIRWSRYGDMFLGYDAGGAVYQISTEGELEKMKIPAGLGMYPDTFFSPDGKWNYWIANTIPQAQQPGLWLARVGDEPTFVLDEIVLSEFWSPDDSEMYIVSYREGENIARLHKLNLLSLEPELLLGEFRDSRHFEWVP